MRYLINWSFLITAIFFYGCGGSKGETGPAGPKGDTGAAGAAGITISSGFSCTKVSGGFNFHYNGITYSTGDVFVECDSAGTSFQVTGTRVYKSNQNGATTFGCLITFDSDGTATSGYWNFTANNGKTAVYTDSGSGLNGTTVTFSSSDCTAF